MAPVKSEGAKTPPEFPDPNRLWKNDFVLMGIPHQPDFQVVL
jgi:hypothetical protein